MSDFLTWFFGYQTKLVEKLSQHTQQAEILASCSNARPIDDVIAYLCQRLGQPPAAWSAYTATLTAYSTSGAPPSLSTLDARIANFNRRFGAVIVVSNRTMAKKLRQQLSIAITEMTEFELFTRRVETIRYYKNAANCMVVGSVDDKEIAVVLKDGDVTNLSINSAPLVRPDIIYIVGALALAQLSILPPHKKATDTFIGRDLPGITLLLEHHTLTPTVLLFGVHNESDFVDTARWNTLTNNCAFTLITKNQVQFCSQNGVCVESGTMETARDFLLRREV